MLQLRQLSYISKISPGMTPARERQLIGLSKRYNRQAGLTGVIASSGTHFLQVLEGTRQGVDDLMHKVQLDGRHFDVRVIFDREIQARQYASWSMGYFHSLDLADELAKLHDGSLVIDPDVLVMQIRPDDLAEGGLALPSSFGQLREVDPSDIRKESGS